MVMTRAQRKARKDESGTKQEDDGLAISLNSRTNDSCEMVFANDLLLDTILRFAMDDEDDEEQRNTANSCKLVQHLWLERTSAVLQKSPPDWYKLELNSFGYSYRLEKFVTTFSNSPANRIPPFTLEFWFDTRLVVTERIYSTLLNCIAQCGAGLRKLDMTVDADEWVYDPQPILHPLTPQVCLPKLKSVEINIPRYSDGFICKNVHERAKLLLESVLDGAECLNDFSLIVNGNQRKRKQGILPVAFEDLKLPHALTKIIFKFTMRSGLLAQLLTENPLPNLTELNIVALSLEHSIGHELTRVLNKFCHHLKRLECLVYPNWETTSDNLQKTITVPVMECLEVIVWNVERFEWSVHSSVSFEKHFPALKSISLGGQTYEMLQKFLQNTKFHSVEEAQFRLEPDKFVELDRHDSQILQQTQRVQQAFPNVVRLTLATAFTIPFSHIKYVLQEMRQLQELELEMDHCPQNIKDDLDEFDCLFLGLRPEEVTTLDARRDDWKMLTRRNMPVLRKLDFGIEIENNQFQLSSLGWNYEEEEESEDESEQESEGESEEESEEQTSDESEEQADES